MREEVEGEVLHRRRLEPEEPVEPVVVVAVVVVVVVMQDRAAVALAAGLCLHPLGAVAAAAAAVLSSTHRPIRGGRLGR